MRRASSAVRPTAYDGSGATSSWMSWCRTSFGRVAARSAGTGRCQSPKRCFRKASGSRWRIPGGDASTACALVRRLVARDQAELQAAGEAAPPPRSAPELVDGFAALARARLTGEGRRRSLARYTCAVESVRDPELREILVPRDNAGRDAVRAFVAAHGAPDPDARTLTLLACVDGLILDSLLTGAPVSRDALQGLVAAALRP
ncbi:TetR family transcriptional regulator C-terminal domain-containing protein [Streptomyces sp. NPDC048258]|uniref:TetR family transcriptional regulator C-terminal domain-containing protein n=1 Tax=Streptomyces sp. NPDC048258 TaxID=3365527 RepID=UPI00371664EC